MGGRDPTIPAISAASQDVIQHGAGTGNPDWTELRNSPLKVQVKLYKSKKKKLRRKQTNPQLTVKL